MRRHIPNAVTALRLLCTAAMFAINADFSLFWFLYALCGISDVLDGALARKLRAESRLGSRLDSIADLAFTAVCAVQLLPQLHLPPGLWICIAVIAALQISAIIAARHRHCSPEQHHSAANRLAGLLLFCALPLYQLPNWDILAFLLCPLAFFASVQQLIIILRSNGGTKHGYNY